MKKTYFVSDFHLGVDAEKTSKERERQIVRWMDSIKPEAAALYLVGDVFDFWFEYLRVVPKGHVRLFGKLAEWRDAGIPVYFFTGNHDMWMFRYFEEELDIPIYRKPLLRNIQGKLFFIGHGDGLGPGDHGYKFIKKVFADPMCQWLFERLHPNFGIWLMQFWSRQSKGSIPSENIFLGPEKEWLIAYCQKKLEEISADFFIFGHRHLPIDYTLRNGKSRYINLGDWLTFNSYAVFDGNELVLKFFENENASVFGG